MLVSSSSSSILEKPDPPTLYLNKSKSLSPPCILSLPDTVVGRVCCVSFRSPKQKTSIFLCFRSFLSASDPHHGRKVCCVSFRSPKQKASIFLLTELPESIRPTGCSLTTTLVIHRLRIAENSAGHPGLPLPPWWCLQLPAAEATCVI